MKERRRSPLNLNVLLAAVEAAPPLAAAEVVGDALAESLDARDVSFLIELTRAVVESCGGQLRDDATVLCFDWHGGPPRDREASEGADR